MRSNPLKKEVEALQIVRSRLETRMREEQKAALDYLDKIYGEDPPEDHQVRYFIEKLARWASLTDAIGWLDEAIQLVENNIEDIDTLLDSLKDRIDWAYGGHTGHHLHSYRTSPLIRHIQSRFYEMEELIKQPLDFTFETATYSDEFIAAKDQFVFNYLIGANTLFTLYWSLEDLLAAIRSDDEFTYTEDGNLLNWKHETQALTISDEELANIRDDINSIITGRTYYGFRDTFDMENLGSTKLIWSCEEATWVIASGFYEGNLKNVLVRGTPATSGFMDANIIVIPYPAPVVKLILSSLYPLPLHSQSLQGKRQRRERGERGPLVSDRIAKRLLTGFVIEGLKQRYPDADPWPESMVKWQLDALWNKILKAKATRDKDLFESTLKNFPVGPGAYPQLVHWFNSILL